MSSGNSERRGNQLVLQKAENELIIAPFDSRPHITGRYSQGIMVVYGWTVGIPFDDVKEYVSNFKRKSESNPNRGFFFFQDGFTLSHEGAKMRLTVQEATKIVSFLSEHYDL